MEIFSNPLVAGGTSLAVAAAFTYIVRELAQRYGFVAKPKSDRWHKRPTAMMGGVAIFAATVVMYASVVPKSPESLIIMGASSFLFFVGLLDDILNIKPYQKLIGQLIGATVIVGFGLTSADDRLRDPRYLDHGFLVDRDNQRDQPSRQHGRPRGRHRGDRGAVAGARISRSMARSDELLLVSVFIGALLGFLVFNFNPASIFMGDCGSMFVGFLLASSVLFGQTGGRSRGIFSILAVPVLDPVRADLRYDVSLRSSERSGDEKRRRAAATIRRTVLSRSAFRSGPPY